MCQFFDIWSMNFDNLRVREIISVYLRISLIPCYELLPFACAEKISEKMEERNTQNGGLKRRSLRSDKGAKTIAETEYTKQNILKSSPSSIELSISTLFHAGVLGYYLFVLLSDVEALRLSEDAMRVLMGRTQFGGRWKFLTYINLVCVSVRVCVFVCVFVCVCVCVLCNYA